MLALMQQNIALNNVQGQVKASIYDWGDEVPNDLPQNPDIILAADCVYFEPAFPLLLSTMKDLIRDKTVCYFCFKKRRRADLNFIKSAKKAFQVEEVQDDPDRATYSRQNLFLYVDVDSSDNHQLIEYADTGYQQKRLQVLEHSRCAACMPVLLPDISFGTESQLLLSLQPQFSGKSLAV